MGTLVKATARDNTKPTYTLADVAAAAVTVADGELALFIGATVPAQVSGAAGLMKVIQGMREMGWPNPTTLQVASARYNVLTGIFASNPDSAAPTLNENQIAVLQGFDFAPAGFSGSAHSRRMFEKALEEVLKVA